jgi:hypothetical protein
MRSIPPSLLSRIRRQSQPTVVPLLPEPPPRPPERYVDLQGDWMPERFVAHYTRGYDAEIVEGGYDLWRTQQPTGRCWVYCSCGWRSSPPKDQASWDEQPLPRGEAWAAYFRHLPDGFLAYQHARQLWRSDHPTGPVIMPRGWEAENDPLLEGQPGRYSWWNYRVTVGDEGALTIVTG